MMRYNSRCCCVISDFNLCRNAQQHNIATLESNHQKSRTSTTMDVWNDNLDQKLKPTKKSHSIVQQNGVSDFHPIIETRRGVAHYWGPGDPVPGAHFQGEGEVQRLLPVKLHCVHVYRILQCKHVTFLCLNLLKAKATINYPSVT